MINNIIWDFDGVLLKSTEVRTNGFIKILKDFDKKKVQKLINYHLSNGGLSRYVKLSYFFSEIMCLENSDKLVLEYAEKYSSIMRDKLCDSSYLNQSLIDWISYDAISLNHHIASGSDEKELRYLCNALGISHLFTSISGSPKPKNDIVKDIVESYGYSKAETVLVGDSINDYAAAEASGIFFTAYGNDNIEKHSTFKLF